MHLGRWLGFAAVMAGTLASTPARAWVESHQAGDDVRVTVGPDGVAVVEHVIPYRVRRGPLRSFELTGVESGVVAEPVGTITSESGEELGATVTTLTDHVLRVAVDEPRKLLHGDFTFKVRYKVDLVAARELVRDGSLWRLSWTAPTTTDGFDGAKYVFELPSAPEPPKIVRVDTGAIDDSALGQLTRMADHDELQIVRPHVARGEGVAWALRLDGHAFPAIAAPSVGAPPPQIDAPSDTTRERQTAAAIAVLALFYFFLVRHKGRVFDAACRARGVTARALVPLGHGPRGALAAALLAAGAALEATGSPTIGALLVAGAMLAASLRGPMGKSAPRGPGAWLPLRPADAFDIAGEPGHWLDLGTLAGKVAFGATGVVVVGAAIAAQRFDGEVPYLIVLDAFALVPLFVTGRASQLPQDPAVAPAPRLEALFRRLTAVEALRTVPIGRIPTGDSHPDELRLSTTPRAAMPGLLAIETGVAWGRTPTAVSSVIECLVRVQDGSAAARRMAAVAPFARSVTGRRVDERVLRIVPAAAGGRGAFALVTRLGHELVDRRAKVVAFEFGGAERRVPPKPVDRGARVAA
jgi:hypothetical protein